MKMHNCILLTKDTLNEDKSKLVKEEHSLNILFIFVTNDVSKELKFKDNRDLQLKNILPVFSTDLVLYSEK